MVRTSGLSLINTMYSSPAGSISIIFPFHRLAAAPHKCDVLASPRNPSFFPRDDTSRKMNSWWKLPLASTSSSKVSVEVFPVPATSRAVTFTGKPTSQDCEKHCGK